MNSLFITETESIQSNEVCEVFGTKAFLVAVCMQGGDENRTKNQKTHESCISANDDENPTNRLFCVRCFWLFAVVEQVALTSCFLLICKRISLVCVCVSFYIHLTCLLHYSICLKTCVRERSCVHSKCERTGSISFWFGLWDYYRCKGALIRFILTVVLLLLRLVRQTFAVIWRVARPHVVGPFASFYLCFFYIAVLLLFLFLLYSDFNSWLCSFF